MVLVMLTVYCKNSHKYRQILTFSLKLRSKRTQFFGDNFLLRSLTHGGTRRS